MKSLWLNAKESVAEKPYQQNGKGDGLKGEELHEPAGEQVARKATGGGKTESICWECV